MTAFRQPLRLFLFFALLSVCGTGAAGAQSPDLEKRVALAEKMLEIRPVRAQIERAVDSYIAAALREKSENERELFRMAMLRAINVDALEKVVIDAYAETFTEQELMAMVEYYGKPEARSAAAKESELSEKISPEIIKMLDQAVMKARTGQ